jgi:hypothetical protein
MVGIGVADTAFANVVTVVDADKGLSNLLK